MRKIWTFLLCGLLLAASPAWCSPGRILAPGAKLHKLAGGFSFAEGLTCDSRGDVFFTDQPNNRIMEWSVAGRLTTFKQPAGRANGMCFDKKGDLIVCADEHDQLWSVAPNGKVTVLVRDYRGKRLNGPNDVWVRPDQGMYITDPFYLRSYWHHKKQPQETEQVYFLSADHRTLKRVTHHLNKPNGIVGTPDGKTLFVADIGADKTYAYDIMPDGSLTHKRLVCPMGSDGMTIDDHGDFYLTGHGVTVFDRTGKKVAHIAVPEKWVGNICFGGRDKRTLFMAASRGLYAIRTRYRGANPAK